jgi:hypothetical protein
MSRRLTAHVLLASAACDRRETPTPSATTAVSSASGAAAAPKVSRADFTGSPSA